ncbi:hypothetical protein PPL_04664 [Heterostelium album PN500]|uniref:Uncharacterized protein n=1 Tax=Heterostelium pallidum (strain ATCC 26659 / Pp 5 / PN500) TaxID=670386 RepID=D3B873_HETP5|nr:hypothetical protein PPL_04664 [Heterostelium album PN500]EFA82241.1 hypothetical protein PPL_04664 [Heterostelium album PN500]|eukprot:XP_020434358.1 hypothetical protein PPL_04664 [Heterostelium album PN500]
MSNQPPQQQQPPRVNVANNLFNNSRSDQSLGLNLSGNSIGSGGTSGSPNTLSSTTPLNFTSAPTSPFNNNTNNNSNSNIPRSSSFNQIPVQQHQQQQQHQQPLTPLRTPLSSSTASSSSQATLLSSQSSPIDIMNSPLGAPSPLHSTPSQASFSTTPIVQIGSHQQPLQPTVTSPLHQPPQSMQSQQQQHQQQQQQQQQGLVGDEITLKRLMKIGNWNNVFKVADMCISNTNNPQSILQYKLCRVIAHVKMKNFKVAYDEIQGIGDIRDLVNCYEAYPQLFPNRKGTMVPFSLRIIKAELACHLGVEKYQLDALYALLAICKREITNLEQQQLQLQQQQQQQQHMTASTIATAATTADTEQQHTLSPEQQSIYLSQLDGLTASTTSTSLLTPTLSPTLHASSSSPNINSLMLNGGIPSESEVFENSNDNNAVSIWRLRERRIIFSIITFIIQKNKDYLLAIKILEDLIHRQQADQWILSALGRIHLQMGSIHNADLIFKIADRLIPEPEISVVSWMNRGLLAVASDQYPRAIECFESVLKLDPTNVAAANNKCISMLYTCDLSGAVATLEQLMQKEKEKSIDETLIFNICSLYELSSERSSEKKKAIMGDIARRAPDNFDFKVFKITQPQTN